MVEFPGIENALPFVLKRSMMDLPDKVTAGVDPIAFKSKEEAGAVSNPRATPRVDASTREAAGGRAAAVNDKLPFDPAALIKLMRANGDNA